MTLNLRGVRVVVAAAAAVGMPAVGATSASAYTAYYCGSPNIVYPGTGCWNGENHTYDQNRVSTDPYGGSTNMGEKLMYKSGQVLIVYSDRRGYGVSFTGYSNDTGRASYLNYNTFMGAYIFNWDDSAHHLKGRADA